MSTAEDRNGPEHRRVFVPLVAAGLVAAFLYSNFILDWMFSDHGVHGVISNLEVPGQPNATLLRITDVVCDALVLLLLPWVRRRTPRGPAREIAIWSTALFAIGSALAAIVPLPCSEAGQCQSTMDVVERNIHTYASILAEAVVYVGAAALAIALRRVGPRWVVVAGWLTFVIGGLASTALFTWFHSVDAYSLATGLSQRFHVLTVSVWIACLGLYAAGLGVTSGEETPP